MILRHIKAHFILDKDFIYNSKDSKYIFKGYYSTFTIYFHHKNGIHVTGMKSNTHLKDFSDFKTHFNVKKKEVIIDNHFTHIKITENCI